MSPALPAETRDELLLSVGGIVVEVALERAPRPFVEQVRGRYGSFLIPSRAGIERDVSLRLALTAPPRPGAPNRLADTEASPLVVTTAARAITAKRWDFELGLTGRAAHGRMLYRGAGRCEASPFALDCALRVIFATLLPRVGGMLVHGCGLRHAAIGVVFPGASGAGKTTLARKAPDADDVLSDEIVAIRRLDDGWRVFGTPFWGDFARGGISMRSWPLRTLGFLAQTPNEVAMAPIVSSEATLRLLGCFLAFALDRASVRQNLALAARLCAEVRSVEARLTKTAPTASIFRKLGPHLGPEVTRPVPPANAREMISEFRALLRKQPRYAFRPKTAGAWLKSGESLRVEAPTGTAPALGDVLLAWSPGPTPEEDALACYRFTGRERSERPLGEILGRITLVARDGKTRPLPERMGDLARSFGPLLALPMARMTGTTKTIKRATDR